MAAKIAFLILAIALTGAALLSVRQQRLQLVHEMTDHLERAERKQRAVWRVRADLAKQITPDQIREAIDRASAQDGEGERFGPAGMILHAGWLAENPGAIP